MTISWQIAAIVLGALGLFAAIACFLILRRSQRILLRHQQTLAEQLGTIDDAVRMLEDRLAEIHHFETPAEAPDTGAESVVALGDAPASENLDAALHPELQAAIAAAALAAAGPSARLRSIRPLKPHDDSSPWSQQGRMLVQSSHNLRQ